MKRYLFTALALLAVALIPTAPTQAALPYTLDPPRTP